MTNGNPKLLRVGVVGCGRVAQHHLRFISASSLARCVGVADLNRATATKVAGSFGVEGVFDTAAALLAATRVDVLHVTTPPASHYDNCLAAIEAGAHVFVEKPIALTAQETRTLYHRATVRGVTICPDFIQLFHPRAREAISIVESGRLGRVVHVETHMGIDPNEADVQEAPGLHWSFRLPGGFLQNSITHALYLALYFAGEVRDVNVLARSFGTLPQGLSDHLTVLMDCETCTASVTISTATRPRRYGASFHCEHGIVTINFDTLSVVVTRARPLPGFLVRATADADVATQLIAGTVRNFGDVARKRLQPYHGLKVLLECFYRSLIDRTRPPIAPEFALRVAMVEDIVAARSGRVHLNSSPRIAAITPGPMKGAVLVTGASGYVGLETVKRLLCEGYRVRALVRELSRTEQLDSLGVEIQFGDVRRTGDVRKAAQGMEVIVHLAAGLRGSSEYMVETCVAGTANVATAAREAAARQVIYVSSLAVYNYDDLSESHNLSEDDSLEASPESRGIASVAKRRAEDIALAELAGNGPDWTILRPSYILGNGRNLASAVGVSLGPLVICLGSPNRRLRILHVHDVARAISCCLSSRGTVAGRVFVVSSDEAITAKQFVEACLRPSDPNLRPVFAPYYLAAGAGSVSRLLRSATGRGPDVSAKRLRYLFSGVGTDSSRFRQATGWHPRPNLLETLRQEVAQPPRGLPLTTPAQHSNAVEVHAPESTVPAK